jgi:hypothetical protein
VIDEEGLATLSRLESFTLVDFLRNRRRRVRQRAASS